MPGLFTYILQIYFRNFKQSINSFSVMIYAAYKEVMLPAATFQTAIA
jgi:hypothetical protein